MRRLVEIGRSRRTDLLVTAAIAAGALALYGGLSSRVESPRIFVDEIRYMDAAASLAHEGGLQVRGEHYGWAPGYPVAVAPVLLVADRPAAYTRIKLVNALFFALAAVPIYLLARRLLPRKASAIVTVLALAIPASVYVGLILTESLAYLASSVALLAIVTAAEEPTAGRQAGALAAIMLGFAVRPQLAALYVAYLLVLLANRRERSESLRRQLSTYWPTVASLGLAGCGAIVLGLLGGRSVLGRYGDLWQSYDVPSVARWFAYHVADLGLYLGLVPLVLLPSILSAIRRRARAGSGAAAAFFATFATVNLLTLVIVAAFSSTAFSQDRLQDRYLFYVVPLWLLAGAVWLADGGRRSRRHGLGGVLLLGSAVIVFPFDRLVTDESWRQVAAGATPIWAELADWSARHGTTGHRLLGVIAVAAAAGSLAVPRRLVWALAVPVSAVLVANAGLLWSRGIGASHQHVFATPRPAASTWIDRVVPPGEKAMLLEVDSPRCPRLGYAFALTEFFNERAGSVWQLHAPPEGALPTRSVLVRKGGELVAGSGAPLRSHWLVAPPGVEIRGTHVASGTRENLALWRVAGPVEVQGARSGRELEAQTCNL